jgi:transaldolase/glucose-6-phosphate isomerase
MSHSMHESRYDAVVTIDPVGRARLDARLRRWRQEDFARRLWARDHTLWSPTPVPELADRLGWLDLPERAARESAALRAFADEIAAAGMRTVVLLGMGGSSLAPEVFQHTFGNAKGHPEVAVLDSTHPDAVSAMTGRLDLRRTLFLVSSKSGTTTETLSFFRHFWHALSAFTDTPGAHFVAITDPGTPLVHLAEQREFRRLFPAPVEVGGRYSALSVFGLVPAALIGIDLGPFVERARSMAAACGSHVAVEANPGLVLGAILAEETRAGRDKVTLLTSPRLASLPSWIEQLVAESTGKLGKGIVPVCDEPPGAAAAYGADRLFVAMVLGGDPDSGIAAAVDTLAAAAHPVVRLSVRDIADVGAEFFRWEVATAAAGAALGINPFDQPDVQLAKDLAKDAMASSRGVPSAGAAHGGEVSADEPSALAKELGAWLRRIRAGDYVGIQAYLAPTAQTSEALRRMRATLQDRLRVATTAGFGPRFLHSTGQLHKGGPDSGVFLQLVDEPARDLPVPETDYTFGALIRAQALGDFGALRQRGRRALRVNLGVDAAAGLTRLLDALARA